MIEPHHPFYPLLQLLSPNYTLANVKLRDDYIFEAPPVGFFKLAHLENEAASHNALVLYYARHPEDFNGQVGPQTSTTNSRPIYPIWIEEIPKHVDAKWDVGNPRQQYDTTWVLSKIMNFVHEAPRVLVPELNLFCHEKDSFRNLFVKYDRVVERSTPWFSKIMVTTNSTRDPHHFDVFEPKEHENRTGILQQYKLAKKVIEWRPAGSYALGVQYEEKLDSASNASQKPQIRRHFIEDEFIPTTISDFLNRVRSMVEKRVNPSPFCDHHHLPLVRIHEKLQKKLDEVKDLFKQDRESAIIKLFASAVHLVLDGGISLLINKALEGVADVAHHERHPGLPASLGRVKEGKPSIAEVDSRVRDLFLMVHHPEKLKELSKNCAWLHPDKHLLSVAPQPQHIHTKCDNGFNTWLQSQFFLPVGSFFRFFTTGGQLVSLHDANKMKVVHASAPNGLQMYYLPEQQKLYAYYHESKVKLVAAENSLHCLHFPEGMNEVFQKGMVVGLDLKRGPDAAVEIHEFQNFATKIHRALGATGNERLMRILSAQAYRCAVPQKPATCPEQAPEKLVA